MLIIMQVKYKKIKSKTYFDVMDHGHRSIPNQNIRNDCYNASHNSSVYVNITPIIYKSATIITLNYGDVKSSFFLSTLA